MQNSNNLWIVLALMSGCVAATAQMGANVAAGSWEPRNLVTKAGLVVSYDPGNTATETFNPAGYLAGNGVSWLSNRVSGVQSDLQQGTAANQPIISRVDSAGNLLKQSSGLSNTWTRVRINAFSETDTGAAGAGSFENTARITDPIGGNTADFLQEDATASNDHTTRQVITLPAGVYTWSLNIYPTNRNYCILYNDLSNTGKYFDLTGAGAVLGNFVAAPTAAAITTNGLPAGWYRVSATFTTASQSAQNFIFYFSATGSSQSYNGDNTSGAFLWGSSLVPSTWTPVTGATAALGYVATTTVPIFPGLGGRSVLYFDGSAYRMQTAGFTLNQPNYWIVLANPWTWTLNDAMMDGVNNNSGKIYQADTAPKIRASAGTASAEFTPPPAGTWRVLNVVFDGANSRMSTNGGAWTVSDAGTAAMGGFTLGSAGTAGTTYWHGLIGRVLGFSKTNDVAEMNYCSWGPKKQTGLY